MKNGGNVISSFHFLCILFYFFFFILYMIFSTTLHLSCEWHSTKQKGFVYMEPTWNIHQNEWKEILHLTCFTATSPCFPTMCVVVSHVIIAFWFPFFICTEKSTSLNELSMICTFKVSLGKNEMCSIIMKTDLTILILSHFWYITRLSLFSKC